MTNMVVTAYCACQICCGSGATGITASGAKPVEGITIAAPRRIPFGTRCHIEGIGWRTVQDRLAPRFDDRLDIYFHRHQDALRWGIRRCRVTFVPHNHHQQHGRK